MERFLVCFACTSWNIKKQNLTSGCGLFVCNANHLGYCNVVICHTNSRWQQSSLHPSLNKKHSLGTMKYLRLPLKFVCHLLGSFKKSERLREEELHESGVWIYICLIRRGLVGVHFQSQLSFMLSLKSILYPFKMLWGSTVFRKYDTVLLCVCLFLAGTGWTLLARIIVYAKIMQMEESTLKNRLSITLYLDIMFRSTKTR